MPTHIFYELENEKKRNIIHTGITEFSKYGYYNSSTNRIVKNCGISKGSLFKYFPSKEDFYFYILDIITNELVSDLKKKCAHLSNDIFERIIQYSELEFTWYIQHPEKYRLILQAFTKHNTDIYCKTKIRYGFTGQDIYFRLMEDIDGAQLRWEKQKTIQILKWFLNGFNTDFLSNIPEDVGIDIENTRNAYVQSLTEHMDLLKAGLQNN